MPCVNFPKNNLVAQNIFLNNRFGNVVLYDQPSQNIYSSRPAAHNRMAKNAFAPLPAEGGVQVIWGLDQRIGRGPGGNRTDTSPWTFRDLALFHRAYPGVDDGSQVGDIKLADPDHGDFRVLHIGVVKELDAGPRKLIRIGDFQFGPQ